MIGDLRSKVAQDPAGRSHQVVGHRVRRHVGRGSGFLGLAVAGPHEHAARPDRTGQPHVHPPVADHERSQRIDTELASAEARADASAIGNTLVPTHDGGRVPLSQLARIEVVNGATIIARRENIRQISVRTNIRGRDQGSFVKEAQAKFAGAVKLPPAYSVDWGGQFENLERARKRLTIILPITIGTIFALLFFAFGDAVELRPDISLYSLCLKRRQLE